MAQCYTLPFLLRPFALPQGPKHCQDTGVSPGAQGGSAPFTVVPTMSSSCVEKGHHLRRTDILGRETIQVGPCIWGFARSHGSADQPQLLRV